MPSPILTAADYQEIREQIDTSLDATTLPDATIGRDAYAGAAMREVISRDPLAETRTGADAARVRLAAIYLTAARLCPAVPALVRVTHQETTYQQVAPRFDKRAEELRGLAETELAAVTASGDTTPYRPTMFRTARGRRGQ
jgi:hypothetical protein